MNVNTLKVRDEGYPDSLRNIATPPKQLYWSGSPISEWIHRPKVAVVGSRKMSAYGQRVTADLAGQLAGEGVVIISGLAFGVDITAHRAALAAGGTTAAVLATGLDTVYPAAHLDIANQINKSGTLITEYHPGTASFPGNFVARNRIISGLCDVLLVTEAALKSGSLHTARFALEQGKTVMAVPGNINSPGSEGCNNLIKSGAIPVTSAEDIFFALKLKPGRAKHKPAFAGAPAEMKIISLLAEGVTDQEDLALTAGLDGGTLASALTSLELSGQIRPAGAGNWVIA